VSEREIVRASKATRQREELDRRQADNNKRPRQPEERADWHKITCTGGPTHSHEPQRAAQHHRDAGRAMV
jgi:hypothetical protein